MNLPKPSCFLFVDSIQEMIAGKFIRGTKRITHHDFLYPSSNGASYFPPSLIGETLGQLAAWNVMHTNGFQQRPVAGIVADASLKKPVKVGEVIELEAYIDNLDSHAVTYQGVAKVKGESVFTLNGALGPLLPMNEFIDVEVVKQQFEGLISRQPHLPRESQSLRMTESDFYFDTILSHDPGQSITASKYIDPHSAYFPDHFPKKPVWPLTVLLECVLNLAVTLLGAQDVGISLRKIKMKEFVRPGSQVTSTLSIKSQTNGVTLLQSHTELNAKRVCVLELVYGTQQ